MGLLVEDRPDEDESYIASDSLYQALAKAVREYLSALK